MKKIIFSGQFLLFVMVLSAQETLLLKYSSTITKEELSEHVYTLASEAFDGRYTGSEGQRMAAEYIQKEFKEDGLVPPGLGSSMPYFQEFKLDKCYWNEQEITSKGLKFMSGQDFVFLSEPQNVSGTYDVVFAGYGLDDTAYSNYGDLDVKGKIAAAFSGEPRGKDGNYIISGRSEPSRKSHFYNKADVAKEKGAAGIILIAREEKDFRKFSKYNEESKKRPEIDLPSEVADEDVFSLYTDMETAAAILNADRKQLEKLAKGDPDLIMKNTSMIGGELTVKASSECYSMNTENVIGIVEGTDLKEEAVVVIAHFDHHGRKDGKLYPGADDNASGTAAMLELAEAFARAALDGNRPRRTVVFIAATAEEIGLFGSQYYSEHPIIPLESTCACINIDMIGRVGTKYKDLPQYISGFAYESVELFELSRKYNALMAPGLKDLMEYRPNLRGGSDHFYFAKAGIPSIFYFTGIHKDYHEPSDTPDKLLYDRMEQTVKAIFGTAWDLANSRETVKGER